tara:strand:+ start:1034 stop:2878 length:1845 start_codon:yes stop_codon:yes gene_type:complete
MASKAKKTVAKLGQKSYLSKDFVSFRNDLIAYAKNYFPDKIQDFSEPGVGGLLVEMAAYVGDTMSYYLDHQFNELNPATAVETKNIQAHARNAGVKPSSSAPAVVEVTFYIAVPATFDGAEYVPSTGGLPIIKKNTALQSNQGTTFILDDDLNFAETDYYGKLKASYNTYALDASGTPTQFLVKQVAECISGNITSEAFTIPNTLVPFRSLTLANPDVTDILMVKDTAGNEYHEVEFLTQDTVFKRFSNINIDQYEVPERLEVIPAPYRFIVNVDYTSRLASIQFGSGDGDSLDDDIIPDPSELALPLYGTKTLSRFSIDPNSLLKTKTLGISPVNTTISVMYRYGGGISDNVKAGSIRTVSKLFIEFPLKPPTSTKNTVLNSLDVTNLTDASGGASAVTLEEMRSQIFAARNQQSRIVTQDDLLARIYTLPSKTGRVFRAGISKSAINPMSSRLHIISRDSSGNLAVSPDALKRNLQIYLNEFRLISDAIEILDAAVINYQITFSIVCSPNENKSTVVARAANNLKTISAIKYFQIDQPLVEADIINSIINTEGVLSLVRLSVTNINTFTEGRSYSDFQFNILENTFKGLIIGPVGSIFELKYPSHDIIGSAE